MQARLSFCSVQDGRINKEYIIMTMTVRLLPGNTQQSYMTGVSPLLYYSSRSHSFKDLNASPFFRKAGAKISTFIVSLQIFPELFFEKFFLTKKQGPKTRPIKEGRGSRVPVALSVRKVTVTGDIRQGKSSYDASGSGTGLS